MRRVIVPALLAIAMVASSSADANAFGLFDKLCKSGCDAGCDVACEPTCGCEAPCAPACEPACGCEAPACGCEADPCCDSGCSLPKMGLLKKLFGKHNSCCDSGCAPACGCEVIEPACGCEAPCAPACEPACGCEAPACCDSCDPCAKKHKLGGLLKRLFNKHNNCCDSGCEAPACCEPTCGCEAEPSCGFGR